MKSMPKRVMTDKELEDLLFRRIVKIKGKYCPALTDMIGLVTAASVSHGVIAVAPREDMPERFKWTTFKFFDERTMFEIINDLEIL